MILPELKCERNVGMKKLFGKTVLWRFPIMCEEIGIESEAFPTRPKVLEKYSFMEISYVSSSQQFARQAPVIS